MKWFTKGVRGSISLFLSMIILLLVILEGFLIDGSKVLAAKMMMSTAGDLAMNAGLTYYDDALRRVYGLFAVSKTEAELTENLEKYFKETLGEATGSTGTNGYTDNLLQFVEQSIKGGWNDQEASKLLDMSVTSFHAAGLKNTALSDSYVIKNQILEYMKYRGPASLGYGMLEKLFAFKDLNRQQKAVETKLEYEETMSDIQKACENAYQSIVVYNGLLSQLTPEYVEAESDAINKDIYETVIAVFALNVAKKAPEYNGRTLNTGWNKKKAGFDSYDVEAAFRACGNYRSLAELYSKGGSGSFLSNKESGDRGSHVRAAMQAVRLTVGYMENFDQFQELYTAWVNWEKYYEEEVERLEEEISDAEDSEEDGEGDGDLSALMAELEELNETNEEYEELLEIDGSGESGVFRMIGSAGKNGEGILSAREAAAAVLESDINYLMEDATERLNTIWQTAIILENRAKTSQQLLDTIISTMATLKAKGESWQGAINNLEEGDVRTSMQSDYSNKSKELDEGKIRHLRDVYLQNGLEYAQILINSADPVKAVNFGLKESQGKSSYAGYLNNYWNNSDYQSTTEAYTNQSYSQMSSFVSEWTTNASQTGALEDPAVTVFFLDAWGGQSGSGKWKKMKLDEQKGKWDKTVTDTDEFYQYLQRVCPKSEGGDEEEKSSAKSTKSKLFEKAENVSFDGSGLTSNRMDGGGDTKSFTSTGSGADDKDVSKNAKENTKSSGNFLEQVGALLTKGRDKLYLSEYATEMFSYYTVDKPDGTAVKKTLSNIELSEKNNYFYKAEVEYILWGDGDPGKDVSNTLATIFGIRFLLNTLYAFTGDPEIRSTSLSLATAIAGWTGFGVPLVQSVIIIGFALAETALDLGALKEGESVPIYKSTNTWTIKPSGFGQSFKNEVGEAINRNVKKLENGLFEGLNELTADGIGELNQKLNQFGKEKVDDIISTATATVLTPVEERLVGLVNVITPDGSGISTGIDQALAGVRASIEAEPDSVQKTAKLKAVDIMSTQCKAQLVSTIQSVQNQNGLTAGAISDRISAALNSCKTKLESGLRSTVESSVNKLTQELQSSIDAGSDRLQEEVSKKVDEYLVKIDCGVSFAEIPDSGSGQSIKTSAADVLSMNYADYLWLFIAVTSMSDGQEEKMLQRIGALIEKNMTLSTNPYASKNKSFTIAGAYTMIGVEASADLRTAFFSLPVPTAGGGSVTFGSDQVSVGYRSIMGY